MTPAAFLMDKMGNDSEGIVVLMVVLLALVSALWLGSFVARYIRRKTQKTN